MNRCNLVCQKIRFLIGYTSVSSGGDVDLFSDINNTNLVDILSDMVENIRYVQKICKNAFSGKYISNLCYEFVEYIRTSFYKTGKLKNTIQLIENEILKNNFYVKITWSNRKNLLKSWKVIEQASNKLIIMLKSTDSFYWDIWDNIVEICMNTSKLEKNIFKLKCLINEMLYAGCNNQIPVEYFYKNIQYLTNAQNCNELIGYFLRIFKIRKKNNYEFILEIENLAVIIPIKIDNLYIYNPIRKELYEFYFKKIFDDKDYIMLTEEEKDLFQKYNVEKKVSEEEMEHIVEVNSHIRVEVRAYSSYDGLMKAQNIVDDYLNTMELITGIHYQYNKSGHTNLDTKSGCYQSYKKASRLISWEKRNKERCLYEKMQDKNDLYSRIMNIKSRDTLFKAITQFNEVNNFEKSPKQVFSSCFICIDSLLSVSKEYYSIKQRLINILPKYMAVIMYKEEIKNIKKELWNTVCYYKNEEIDEYQRKELDKIKVIVKSDNTQLLIDNRILVYKYIREPQVSLNAHMFFKTYNNINFRIRTVENYVKRSQYRIDRAYKQRNKLFHLGEWKKEEESFNSNFMFIIAKILLEDILNQIKTGDTDADIAKKISKSLIDKKYSLLLNTFL